ncbi:branched-chain 2-oxoacid dehydrogenase complex, E1 protein, beta subunit, putative [Citrifermentans bemidjiense Bem]|uniref:Branched-chain 2-oxoacid dehydrogenase complex, E1 protein, beta subunit, putative n=1 Tax=Citrifermentans bemidjiense (strain ATCC BAA-1014 / DSM 16622 / JCM 12645 / Bem) TaxID=404380 RepID=B5EBM0_CITBB|nr:alpha-ketoacid dehydrogenase subunit beta [Citrifermentans bemidjiense]ACH37489.1 branched-chain 2-oxoacid dehydrogenase complex, E1 protein, beta subunit, putative [Citrifermentans bemidjiense Bem]
MAQLNMVQAINQALADEMARDDRVVLLGEDVGRDGGVFRVTDGLQDRFGAERVLDTPLCESAIMGAAIGMAAYGLRPVPEIQFMGFTYSAFEQLFAHAARLRSRSRGRYSCPLVVRTPYGGGIKAPELHEESTEAIFCHIPGLKVVVPSGPYNAKGLLLAALRDPDPVLFLEPTRLYRMVKEEVPEGDYQLELGKARVARKGSAVTVVAWGSMLERVLRAIDGYDAEVIDLLTLNPLDLEALLSSVQKTGRAVIVHEAIKTCGLGAEIAATLAEEAMLHLRAPILRVTAPDVPVPLAKLIDQYLPGPDRIRAALDEVLKY